MQLDKSVDAAKRLDFIELKGYAIYKGCVPVAAAANGSGEGASKAGPAAASMAANLLPYCFYLQEIAPEAQPQAAAEAADAGGSESGSDTEEAAASTTSSKKPLQTKLSAVARKPAASSLTSGRRQNGKGAASLSSRVGPKTWAFAAHTPFAREEWVAAFVKAGCTLGEESPQPADEPSSPVKASHRQL